MKNFKVFTIAAMMAGAAFSFTSCGGAKSETEEKVNLEDGLGYVKQLINAVESGDIKVDKSTKKDITKYFDFKDKSDNYLFESKDFKGYRLDKSFTMNDEVLNSVSYSTFYEDDVEDQAKKDSKTVLEYLEKTLGESEGSGDTYFSWKKSKYTIEYNIFSDGYSLYVKSDTEIEYEDYDSYDDEEEIISSDCDPNFYNLRDDLVDKIIANIGNGKIKIGKTTKEEVAALTGDGADFNHDYKGMNVSGYYSYTGGVLTSFSLNYFYTCDAAKGLLSLDKSELGTDISAELNVDAKKDGTGEDAGSTWKIDGQTLKQSNFSDGYAYYFN